MNFIHLFSFSLSLSSFSNPKHGEWKSDLFSSEASARASSLVEWMWSQRKMYYTSWELEMKLLFSLLHLPAPSHSTYHSRPSSSSLSRKLTIRNWICPLARQIHKLCNFIIHMRIGVFEEFGMLVSNEHGQLSVLHSISPEQQQWTQELELVTLVVFHVTCPTSNKYLHRRAAHSCAQKFQLIFLRFTSHHLGDVAWNFHTLTTWSPILAQQQEQTWRVFRKI